MSPASPAPLCSALCLCTLSALLPTPGELMGRVVVPLWGPLDRWWLPSYLRLKMELALTPIKVGVTVC